MSLRSKWAQLFILVLAGEMIFSLPFHTARFFRPTLLEVYGLNNTQLGDIFALYGVCAMLAYFPGGWLADRFSNRVLMSVALWLTALGGLYMALIPNSTGMALLFAYWGMTTILLFWSALIRTTREWGGQLMQGRAFGLLDGGRGLIAAGCATLIVWLITRIIPSDLQTLNEAQRIEVMHLVIYTYTFFTACTGFFIWLLPISNTHHSTPSKHTLTLKSIFNYLDLKLISLQAIIVMCAYCGYKGLDYYGWYLHQIVGVSELKSAQFTSLGAYIRPIAAITAGFLADRFITSRSIMLLFTGLMAGYTALAIIEPTFELYWLITLDLLFTASIVFGIRGIYFALLQESHIPIAATGTAAGLVSVIGFTPDIFFASIAGRILDSSTGNEGFQYFYWWLTSIAVAGLLSTFFLTRILHNQKTAI